ncbi:MULTISPECIES: acyl-CoA thioesterase [Micrococcaceae]|uniref:acyl-CoA thioesterase n=1 Tax=unclassified Kocuria TaxID=2649579 RepID=UPI001011A276|nr:MULTISPECIES: acyl-CoA thioesterase [unclassified Kocuria]
MSSRILTVNVPLRWGDMDAYHHINNVQIARIMEEARVAAFGPPPAAPGAEESDAPIPLFTRLPRGTQALIAENHIKYRAPLPYSRTPARVEVWVDKITAASLAIEYRIYDARTGQRCVDASTVLAFFNEPEGRIVRISAEQRQLLEGSASSD